MKTKRITIILVLVVIVTVMNISFIKITGNSDEEPTTTLAMENAVALASYECACMVSCYYNYGGGCVIWDGGNCPYWPDFSPCQPIC